jgi:hypothetical protein
MFMVIFFMILCMMLCIMLCMRAPAPLRPWLYSLADCGTDAHAHVLLCPRNMTGTYFASQPQWQAGQDRRCGELVLQYCATIPDAIIRQQVAFECQLVIRQLNIEVGEGPPVCPTRHL